MLRQGPELGLKAGPSGRPEGKAEIRLVRGTFPEAVIQDLSCLKGFGCGTHKGVLMSCKEVSGPTPKTSTSPSLSTESPLRKKRRKRGTAIRLKIVRAYKEICGKARALCLWVGELQGVCWFPEIRLELTHFVLHKGLCALCGKLQEAHCFQENQLQPQALPLLAAIWPNITS